MTPGVISGKGFASVRRVPRRACSGSAGLVFHVLNRGVRKARLFETDDDYHAFLDTMVSALDRQPVAVFAYCLMPNHFHFVASPTVDGQLSEFMRWLTGTHSKRWHLWRGSNGTGCVYQGRFKAFPVQHDLHFLTVCRYVERNPLRAGLVRRAEAWPWGSAHQRSCGSARIPLADWPVDRPPNWLTILNGDDGSTAAVRECVIKSRPFGEPSWVERTAGTLDLHRSQRTVGRPPEG